VSSASAELLLHLIVWNTALSVTGLALTKKFTGVHGQLPAMDARAVAFTASIVSRLRRRS
jgi:hypothetical protein